MGWHYSKDIDDFLIDLAHFGVLVGEGVDHLHEDFLAVVGKKKRESLRFEDELDAKFVCKELVGSVEVLDDEFIIVGFFDVELGNDLEDAVLLVEIVKFKGVTVENFSCLLGLGNIGDEHECLENDIILDDSSRKVVVEELKEGFVEELLPSVGKLDCCKDTDDLELQVLILAASEKQLDEMLDESLESSSSQFGHLSAFLDGRVAALLDDALDEPEKQYVHMLHGSLYDSCQFLLTNEVGIAVIEREVDG